MVWGLVSGTLLKIIYCSFHFVVKSDLYFLRGHSCVKQNGAVPSLHLFINAKSHCACFLCERLVRFLYNLFAELKIKKES